MPEVLVPLAEGFEEVEFVSIVDVLRRGGVEVVTAVIGDTPQVEGSHGMKIQADTTFAKAAEDHFAAIVLPGGGRGVENLRAFEPLAGRLVRQKREGGLICAICAAPLVLMDAGVLESDTHVTCHPSCTPDFDRPCASAPVVEDDGIITGQAAGSAVLFGLVILKALVGESQARKVAAGMVYSF